MPSASGPYKNYLRDIKLHHRIEDADQKSVVMHFQSLHDQLCQRKTIPNWRKPFSPVKPIQGIYLWGGVGRGKTYLMDLFFNGLPFLEKQRLHFHRFMYQVHQALYQYQGQKNPLKSIARQWASKIRILCFDEFYVSDIGDAMILAELLRELLAQEVVLVATSNVPPEGLYKNGLQRDRFLPAIDLLCQHTQVIAMSGSTDFRLRTLEQSQLYYWPLSDIADKSLLRSFEELSQSEGRCAVMIEVLGRSIQSRYVSDGVLWCDFAELCGGPRSQNDYIELSRCYQTVIVSHIPQLSREQEDQARRFIHLVDEFYDRGVKLIISAAVDIPVLYQGQRLQFEFQRTQSRLLEMQSHHYLAKPHQG